MDWKKQLSEIEDEYLIGLTNKGTVKRAYKDKESAAVKIVKTEEAAVLQVEEETVTLHIPLGESKCSCPSRSICRHIILAILTLKESVANDEIISKDDSTAKTADSGFSEKNNTTTETDLTVSSERSKITETDKTSLQEQLWNEIRSYPEKVLYRTMGTRRFASFQNKIRENIQPDMEESSVFTIQLPGENITVKLLSPLEYSSCTCHKKELCPHKAEAILWCKLKAGVLSLKELEESQKKEISLDPEQIKNAAVQMKSYLEELMATGLSRISPDVTDSLERFAIISHNAGLADFERTFRTLGTLYQSYLKRQASFQTADLMRKLTKLYYRVNILIEKEDLSFLAKEAGEFQAEYLPVGNLDLTGITIEHFKDAAGYEGNTVYFLEATTKKWYTYTMARPTFYDNQKMRNRKQKAETPWNLNCSLETMTELQIHLTDARCDRRRRLSSSKETKAEILGNRLSDPESAADWYYEDFGRLFMERIKKPERAESSKEDVWGRDLVLIQPAFCEKAVFSKTDQVLSMTLYDKEKREVLLELPYSKEEKESIRYLEKLKEQEPPCFIGKIYLKDGRIRLIPVDIWK